MSVQKICMVQVYTAAARQPGFDGPYLIELTVMCMLLRMESSQVGKIIVRCVPLKYCRTSREIHVVPTASFYCAHCCGQAGRCFHWCSTGSLCCIVYCLVFCKPRTGRLLAVPLFPTLLSSFLSSSQLFSFFISMNSRCLSVGWQPCLPALLPQSWSGRTRQGREAAE